MAPEARPDPPRPPEGSGDPRSPRKGDGRRRLEERLARERAALQERPRFHFAYLLFAEVSRSWLVSVLAGVMYGLSGSILLWIHSYGTNTVVFEPLLCRL